MENHPIVRVPTELPAGVIDVRAKVEPFGLNLICSTCQFCIPKSRRYYSVCHSYNPDGPQGSPLLRRYIKCPNCTDDLVLGRNIGDTDDMSAIDGAIVTDEAYVEKYYDDMENEIYVDKTHEGVCKHFKEPLGRSCYYGKILGRPLPEVRIRRK
ncbi:hypothetical protein CASFOL_032988 [Castilleja foliolosa]|uniref:Uncharacterized protein n=1 Tax=Castilleja foliolosa TaxID=1961234 RepID=A0ABD3C3N6_9LAMI